MDISIESCTKFHRSAFKVTTNAFPFVFIAFTKSHATFTADFLRDFLNISEIHIRGDPDARTAND